MGAMTTKENASVLHDFRVGRVIEGDNWQAGCNCLHLRIRETLVPGERKVDIVLTKLFTQALL